MNKEEFKKALLDQGISITENQLEQLETYKNMLQEWNEKMNLTAITDDEQIWEKHFYDSVYPFLHEEFESMCDVGSGAGFPGIPVQILYPNRKVTLVEPLQKRCRFLKAVKDALQLENLEIQNVRAEDFAKDYREKFDLVSARAVARLAVLLELCVPLIKEKGIFLALKGRNGYQELKAAAPALKALKIHLDKEEAFQLEDESGRINFYFIKDERTPSQYPRNYGTIKKKPLEESVDV